jgi:hypothetical protein
MEANARFFSVFSKDDLLSKNYCFEENKIIQSDLKSGNLRLKKFLFENYKEAKSFPSKEKKIEKVQICQNALTPLI